MEGLVYVMPHDNKATIHRIPVGRILTVMNRVSVKIDKSKWSNSSRRSSEYTGQFLKVDFYSESIGYRCKNCFRNCVFTPEEQKVAFEEDKKIGIVKLV